MNPRFPPAVPDPEAIEEVCKEARSAGIMVMSWDEEMTNSDINWLIDPDSLSMTS